MRFAIACLACLGIGQAVVAQTTLNQGFNQDGTPIDAETGLLPEEGFVPEDAGAPTDLPTLEAPFVVLRGLDTVTGSVTDFKVASGTIVDFERLQIAALSCRYPEGEIGSEAFAFLRIRDQREDDIRFSGWMFASSPALSALDHPRYDVWVVRCSTE